jgi:hypothetical protein
MTEEPKPFTVKDRRHFTPDGQTREAPDADAGAEPEAEPAPPARGRMDAEPPPSGASGAREERVDFGRFLLSLGAQASLALSGEVESQSPQEALAEARSMIGVLEMLKDKTEGRRTPRENDVLEGLLYELRMAYVARAREAGE